jgi:hypothetical protein
MSITHEDKQYDAVYLGGIEPRSNADLAELVFGNAIGKLAGERPGLLTGAIHLESILKTPLMWLQTTEPGKSLTAEKGSPLTIEAMKEFLLPEASAEISQGEIRNGALAGRVLASGTTGMELGCGAGTLKQLKAGKAAELTLEIAGSTVPIILLPDMEHRHRPFHIIGTAGRQKQDLDFFMRIFSYMIDGGDDVFRAIIGKTRSTELTGLLKQYKAGCTFNSRDGYQPKNPAEAETVRARCLALWEEGVSRWVVPGGMSAVLMPHWDDPKKSSLSCRVFRHNDANVFAQTTGADYLLRVVE